MLHELTELNQIRLEDDRSYSSLSKAIGFKDPSVLYRILNGKAHPTDRSLFKIRRFLDARKKATRGRKAVA